MGYEGWLSIAGTEVINNDRVRSYAAQLVPSLHMDPATEDETGQALRRILDDEPYRSPMLDDAPWVDPDDPDTFDFCGVFGLSAVGLTDSTRVAKIVENTQDGGGINGRRKGTRSVRYSVLLVGATQAAVEAGQAWLSAALDGDCDGDCNGSDVCYLSALTDPQDWGDRVTTMIDRNTLSAYSGRYDKHTHTFTPGNTTRQLSAKPFPLPLPCDEIVWTWSVSAVPGTKVRGHTYSEKGQVFTDVVTVDSDGKATLSISDMGQGTTSARCGISLDVGAYVTINAVSVEYRDDAKNSACFDHYQRQLFEASPIDGPTTVTDYAMNCGAMRKVEFTIATGIPYTFGRMNRLLAMSSGLGRVSEDQSNLVFQMDQTIPVKKTPTAPTWIADPDCPKVPSPPRPNPSFTSCKVSTDWYDSYGISIPGSAIPLWHEAVPRLLLTSGEVAARGVRVRFFPRPLGTMQKAEDLDPNSSCGEFVVDYIPPSSTFVLDGITRHCVIKRPGKPNTTANHLLSAPTAKDLFTWPVLTCGTDYLCVVDVDGNHKSLVGMWLYLATRWH